MRRLGILLAVVVLAAGILWLSGQPDPPPAPGRDVPESEIPQVGVVPEPAEEPAPEPAEPPTPWHTDFLESLPDEVRQALAEALRDASWGEAIAAIDAYRYFTADRFESVAELVRALRIEELRLAAAVSLAHLGLEDGLVVPILIEFLGSDSGFDASDAARALGSYGPRAAAAAHRLAEILGRENTQSLTWNVGMALCEIGPAAAHALPGILRSLQRTREDHYWPARALVALGPAAFPEVEKILRGPRTKVREAVEDAVADLGPAAAPLIPVLAERVAPADDYPSVSAGNALGRIGMAALPTLRRLLGSKSLETRSTAILASWSMEPEAARAFLGDLLGLLDDADPTIRYEALKSLRIRWRERGMDLPRVVPLVIDRLDDPDRDVRQAAAATLGWFGDGASVAASALSPLLRDDDPHVRQAAAEALGQFADPKSVPPLRMLLKDENVHVLGAAVVALGACGQGTGRGAADLGRVLEDPDPALRIYAAESLWRVTGSAERSLPLLADALASSEEKLFRNAVNALERLADAFPQEVVPLLVKTLESEDEDMRWNAACGLRRAGPAAASALPAIVRLLDDEEIRIQRVAMGALARIGPAARDALPALGIRERRGRYSRDEETLEHVRKTRAAITR